MIAADLDVRRHEVRDRRIGAAEHHVLARRLQVVVDDPERPRPVPAGDRLGVRADLLEVGEMRVDDRDIPRIQRDAPAGALRLVAMEIAALEGDVVRQGLDRGRPTAELDQVVTETPSFGAISIPTNR